MTDALTTADIERQLIAIASEARHDPEAAASRERRLLRDVLLAIAQIGDGPGQLARAALRSWEIPFRRF